MHFEWLMTWMKHQVFSQTVSSRVMSWSQQFSCHGAINANEIKLSCSCNEILIEFFSKVVGFEVFGIMICWWCIVTFKEIARGDILFAISTKRCTDEFWRMAPTPFITFHENYIIDDRFINFRTASDITPCLLYPKQRTTPKRIKISQN